MVVGGYKGGLAMILCVSSGNPEVGVSTLESAL